MRTPTVPHIDPATSTAHHRWRFLDRLSTWAVGVCLVGVLGLVPIHAMTGDWELAFYIAGGLIVAAILIGAVMYGLRWSDEARAENGRRPRRIGWGSRITLLLGLPWLFICVVEASMTSEATSDRTSAAIAGVITAGFVLSAAMGKTTSLVRRSRVALSKNRELRKWTLGLLVAGAFCAFMCLAGWDTTKSLSEHGVATTATVTNITTYRHVDDYFLSYKLPNGSTVHCSTEDVTNAPNVGDRIRVLYDSTDADVSCQSLDYGLDYVSVWIFGIISAICLTIGSGLLWEALRKADDKAVAVKHRRG